MRVGVLGPLLVELGDREVAPAGQRLRDVIAVLLQRRGRVVPAEVLLNLVWADRAADLTAAAVHTVVARLRRQLGRDAIATRGGGYLMPSAVGTDEDLFLEMVDQARRSREAGDLMTAAQRQRDALLVWRGDEAYGLVSDELVEADRSRLAHHRAAVAEHLASLLVDHPEVGQPGEASRRADELIVRDPLRERGYQLAMLAAFADQRQGDALAAYALLRRRLRDELGIDPSRETRLLHQRILEQDPTLRSNTGRVSLAHSREPPAPTTELVGRDLELARLRGELASNRRLIAIVGPAGVGKSRLLSEVGRWRPEGMRTTYVEMPARPDLGVEEVAEAVAVAHGLPVPRENPVDVLAATLADGDRLLLVDEAEWAEQSLAPLLRTLLGRCPGLRVVLASRHPLQVSGELVLPIGPLPASTAVRLLTARLADRAVEVGDDPETSRLLAEIAERLDGIPLALELAAGQAGARSLAEVATLVASPLDLATVDDQGTRHRSLRTALAWSTDRLEDPQRTVLRRLAVFAGRFELDVARAVVGPLGGANVDEVIRGLARRALVQVDVRDARQLGFRLLRTVRDLAAESTPPDERQAARGRHRRWYADRWRGQPRRDDLIADVRDQHEDYVDAVRSALESGDGDDLAALTMAVSRFWLFTRSKGPGLRWTSRALDSGLLARRDDALLRVQRAALALHHDSALTLADTELAIAALREQEDAPALVSAHTVRALELDGLGRRKDAVAHSERAVAVARATTLERTADALGVHAYVAAAAGAASEARTAIAEAQTLLDATGSTAARIAVASNLALAWFELDEPARALELLEGADRLVPSMLGVSPLFSVLNTGWAALGVGDGERAWACFGGALPPPGSPPDRMAAETCLGAASALAALGHPHAALALAGAMTLAARVGYAPSPGQLGAVERAQGAAGVAAYSMSASELDAELADRLYAILRAAAPLWAESAGSPGQGTR